MGDDALILYDLAGADPALRFSPHCWKTRMALAHKGLEPRTIPWRFTEKEKISFSGQGSVPILVDGEKTVSDSWRIALHLEEHYADRPSLFGSPEAIPLAAFVNNWADTVLLPAFARFLVPDILDSLAEIDRDYFRRTREARLGVTIEDLSAGRETFLAALQDCLTPLRVRLKDRPFLSGEAPRYADYCVFGMFMWARGIGAAAVPKPGEPLAAWHEALLDLFGGLARAAPRRTA
jgi:glutathione S-transferase